MEFDRIFEKMEIQGDKANHFVYGILVYFLGMLAMGDLAGISACVLAAVGKEVWDHFSKEHEWCWLDLAWTVLGGIAGLLIHLC